MASPVGQNVLLSVAGKTASELSNKDLIHRLKITSLKQSTKLLKALPFIGIYICSNNPYASLQCSTSTFWIDANGL